jgi:hypothetical protein
MELDFIITSVNDKPVSNTRETLDAIRNISTGMIELGGFYPQFEGEYFYAFKLGEELDNG